MLFKDYAKRYLHMSDEVTFLVVRAVKDDHTPFYHAEYWTTPIYSVREWLDNEAASNRHILNDHQAPIDWLSGSNWNSAFKTGRLHSLLVTSDEDITKLYSEKQAGSLIEFCGSHLYINKK